MRHSTFELALYHSLFLISGFMVWSSAFADDSSVYESLPDVKIGRVFFSAAERQRLDQHRHRKTTTDGRRQSNLAGRKPGNRDAAGYILSSSGKSQIYVNGDFVAGTVPKTMSFPGDVGIKRQAVGAEDAVLRPAAAAESSDEDH